MRQAARRRGGFVALTVKGPELPSVAERLAERFDVMPLALDVLLLVTLRELTREQRTLWRALLTADAAIAASGSIGAGPASYARLAVERVTARVAEQAAASGPRTVLLAHRAGLVARYWEVGGRELLVALQNAAGHPPTLRTVCGCSSPWRIPRLRPPWTAGRWMWRTGRPGGWCSTGCS